MKSYKGKRVLLLCTASSIGGTERVVMLQARGLNALGVETRTIIAESERTAATLAWFESEGVEAESNPAVLDVHVPRSREDMIKLAQLVRGWRPDAVSLHYGVNHISIRDVLAIRYGRAKRLVVTVHHPSPLDEMSSRTHKISRIASKLITKLVCLTDALRNQMLTIGVSPGKIAQFTYAIPPPKTYPDRLQSRAKFGIPADAFVVSSLARIELEKGFRELLEAAALVPDPEGKLRVVIAGSGPALDEIRALGKELLGDRAIITGRVDDPAEVYAASDVFALPSYLEGFGLVYIEAAFHWLPSIGTNIGGIPEAIVDGETGLLVPVKDVPATAEAIR
ncbi:MAG: glycosyltransferase family 4 protein, partial [Chthonomonadales bacterium]